jgi:hypothetical protein
MKKPSTPREKKQLEYKKDHAIGAEYPHTFRRSWPRKEAAARRAFRRKVRQLNATLEAHREDNFPDGAEPEAIRRRQVQKWGAPPMGEVIPRRIENRLLRTGWNFFKSTYNEASDRERFSAFLASVVIGRTQQSERLASLFRQALDSESPRMPGLLPAGLDPSIRMWPPQWSRWHDWLQAFFKDEPEWEQRIREWVNSFDGGKCRPT